MSFTVEDVIEAAREVHPAFDERQTPDRTLLRALNRKYRTLFQLTFDIEPTLVASTETITISGFDFSNGHPIPAYERIIGGDMKISGEADPRRHDFELVPWGQRHRASVDRGGYILEETLYLQGTENDWDDVEKIELLYIPELTELSAESDQPNLPDRAQSPLELHGAMFMARRGVDGQPLPIYPDLRQEVREETRLYQQWVAQRESQAELATWGTKW